MFSQGQIVKSKQRTENNGLFLMVILDPTPCQHQFNAVVLKDCSGSESQGDVFNNWNNDQFELSNWEELKRFL